MRAQVLVTTQDCSATAARALLLVAAVLVCPAGVLAQASTAARALDAGVATGVAVSVAPGPAAPQGTVVATC